MSNTWLCATANVSKKKNKQAKKKRQKPLPYSVDIPIIKKQSRPYLASSMVFPYFLDITTKLKVSHYKQSKIHKFFERKSKKMGNAKVNITEQDKNNRPKSNVDFISQNLASNKSLKIRQVPTEMPSKRMEITFDRKQEEALFGFNSFNSTPEELKIIESQSMHNKTVEISSNDNKNSLNELSSLNYKRNMLADSPGKTECFDKLLRISNDTQLFLESVSENSESYISQSVVNVNRGKLPERISSPVTTIKRPFDNENIEARLHKESMNTNLDPPFSEIYESQITQQSINNTNIVVRLDNESDPLFSEMSQPFVSMNKQLINDKNNESKLHTEIIYTNLDPLFSELYKSQPVVNLSRGIELSPSAIGKQTLNNKNTEVLFFGQSVDTNVDSFSELYKSQPVVNVRRSNLPPFLATCKQSFDNLNIEARLHEESMNTNLDPPYVNYVFNLTCETQTEILESPISVDETLSLTTRAVKFTETESDDAIFEPAAQDLSESKRRTYAPINRKVIYSSSYENIPKNVEQKHRNLHTKCNSSMKEKLDSNLEIHSNINSDSLSCYSPSQYPSLKKTTLLRSQSGTKNLMKDNLRFSTYGVKDGFWDS